MTASADAVSAPTSSSTPVRMISVDDHVVEPPDVWTSRLPGKWQDECPRAVEEDGKIVWRFEQKQKSLAELGGRLFDPASGKRDLIDFPGRYEDLRAGCYQPEARVADLDVAGISASLCFPAFPRFCGQEFSEASDRELGLACVRAYNDWMMDEWCGAVPGRLIPLIILPLWDADLSVAEVERCAAKGARAVTFSENPAALGLPSVHDRRKYWDPVFAACADANMPVCTHIGSSSKLPYTSDDAPPLVVATLPSNLAASALADWLYSGLFVRYPTLKLCLSEGGIGWIPAILERADYVFERYAPRLKTGTGFGLTGMGSVDAGEFNAGSVDVRPSELFRDHVFGCFIDDRHGASSIDEIGIDNVMVECDYPHGDSSWPHARNLILEQVAHLNGDEQAKVLEGNARRVFGLEAVGG